VTIFGTSELKSIKKAFDFWNNFEENSGANTGDKYMEMIPVVGA